MFGWPKQNRPLEAAADAKLALPPPIPNGAMMIKEIYAAPASLCNSVPQENLPLSNGAAVMIRDNGTAKDGWFWGWFGWSGWVFDWPAASNNNRLPYLGCGQYFVNRHASAESNQTFSDLKNILTIGRPAGVPPVQAGILCLWTVPV